MENFDYPKCNKEPVVNFSLPESEYVARTRLRLAMNDVIKEYRISKDPEKLGTAVIDIIEGWGF